MTPAEFAEANRTLLPPEGMDNCDPLRVFADDECVISCWAIELDDLETLAKTGKIWVYVRTREGTAPPIALGVEKPFVEVPAPTSGLVACGRL